MVNNSKIKFDNKLERICIKYTNQIKIIKNKYIHAIPLNIRKTFPKIP